MGHRRQAWVTELSALNVRQSVCTAGHGPVNPDTLRACSRELSSRLLRMNTAASPGQHTMAGGVSIFNKRHRFEANIRKSNCSWKPQRLEHLV